MLWQEAQKLVDKSGGTIPLQATAEAILETNRAAEKLDNTLTGNTLVDSLNAANKAVATWDALLENPSGTIDNLNTRQ